jgi:dGTPase
MSPARSARAAYEAWQDRWLAPCAVRGRDSGGRAHPEPPHPYRTAFQRDRDRIVHCSAFRRLDYKTQVFVPHADDHFRTRLTHTLEVAQVSRTLARALRLNEDVAEAAALAHDLGHPPFGHGGEAELNDLMAEEGGFEHNRQSLRVVDYLEHPYPDFRGLNLTQVVRECVALHETRYDRPAGGAFAAEARPPLEGQLVDLADEIAYTSADLEDALSAGWIGLEDAAPLALWQRAWSAAERAAPHARPIHKRIRACKAVMALLIGEAIEATGAAAAGLTCCDEARRAGRCAKLPETAARALRQMQDFLLHRVYRDRRNAGQEAASRRILRELFEALAADPSRLPPRYAARIEADGLRRVICDYVAGMTDRFCRQEHCRVCG